MSGCQHVFEKAVATGWSWWCDNKIVPVPNCLECGLENSSYDHNDENNKFYRKHWNLEFCENNKGAKASWDVALKERFEKEKKKV